MRSDITRIAAVLLALATGCANGSVTGGGPDGGPDGSGGQAGGAGGKGGSGGGPGGSGGSAGAGGAPPSASCAEAAAKASFIGCEFYALDSNNLDKDDNLPFDVVVGNVSSSTAMVTVEARAGGGAWMPVMTAMVPPQDVVIVPPGQKQVEGSALSKGRAYRVRSDVPIIAYQWTNDDQDHKANSTAATILLPRHALADEYFAIAMRGPVKALLSGPGASQVSVVGTVDATMIEVEAKVDVVAGMGVTAIPAGGKGVFMLDDGDVVTLRAASSDGDLTGSFIKSSKPVAVFGGSDCTNLDGMFNDKRTGAEGAWDCDMTEEQTLPLKTWGQNYVAARLEPRPAACMGRTPFGGSKNGWPYPTTWRVVSADDGTNVSFDAPAGVSGIPPATTLARGQVLEFDVAGSSSHFYVTASKAVMLVQVYHCEESMTLSVPVEQFLSDYVFLAPSFFENQIAVTRKKGAAVSLDGTPIADSSFVAAGGGFEVARVALPECLKTIRDCAHRVSGAQVGLAVRGHDFTCAYAYMGGPGLKCVNKATAGGCP